MSGSYVTGETMIVFFLFEGSSSILQSKVNFIRLTGMPSKLSYNLKQLRNITANSGSLSG